MSSPPGPARAEISAFAEAPTEAAVAEAVAHIGRPLPAQVEYASLLHARLPELWIHAVHQAPMAQAMIFGLLLAQDEVLRGSEIRAVAELTDSETADLVLRFHSEAGERSSAQKIALIDMAIPTLRSLSVDEYQRFNQVVEALIESDRRIDLFEYTLSRMIRRHLTRHFERLGPTPVKFRSLRVLLPDIRVLLSTLARVGSRSEQEAAQALRHGAQVLHLTGEHAELLPAERSTLRDVDAALSRYDAATPSLKKSLMLSCAATVMADDRVTDREVELIRAIGDAVDCPVPLFVASE